MLQQENFNQPQSQSLAFPTPVPGYPTYPVYQNPCAWNPAFQMGAEAIQAERGRAQAEIENAQLRMRLGRKELAEDAYSSIGSASGRTYTVDRTGRLVELMNTEITNARHSILQPPFPQGEFYEIKLQGIEQKIVLNSKQFWRDSALLQAFQEIPGIQLHHCRTVKLTATLLRQAIAQRTQVVQLPFYAGWGDSPAGGYSCWTFDDGSTHIRENRVPEAIEVKEPMSAATMVTAGHRFQQNLKLNPNQPEHWLLGTVFHTAALTSLLQILGHPIPLALCVVAERAAERAWLKSFFGWFGDPALSLNQPHAVFSYEALCRCDQPMVILDDRGGNLSAKNSHFLETVLASHQIPYQDHREKKYIQLHSLPVILATSASALTVCPDCITLELSSRLPNSIQAVDEGVRVDYLTAFIQYVSGHIDRFRKLLDEAIKQTFQNIKDLAMDERCVVMLGILLAVDVLVQEFHTFCGLGTAPLDEVCPGIEEWLIQLLEETSSKAMDYGDLAAHFVDVAKSQLQSGTLHPCPIEYEAELGEPIVFYNDDCLFFSGAAMSTVSESLGRSRPIVLHALAEGGLLSGRSINAGTKLTRISTWNAHGFRKTWRVYKLPRAAFDALGDPLIFEGEEFE